MSADTDQVSVGGDAYLTLRALDQTFALPIEFARSVFKIEGLTRVPQAPSHLVGLSNLRGGIIGVVCLANKLDPDAPALGVGALAVAIQLIGVVITSSPGLTSAATIARCNPVVPDVTARPNCVPQNAANSSSNFLTQGPQDGALARSTSIRASCSS